MELAAHGSLDAFLRKSRASPESKLRMCVDAAKGLEYLHEQSLIHRDIAAR
jgi:serine/threonine protein kinase